MTSEHEHKGLGERVSEALDRAQDKLDHLSRDPDDAAGLEAEAERHRKEMGEPGPESRDVP